LLVKLVMRVNLSERFVAGESSVRMTPAGAGPTGKDTVTGGAGRYCAFPGCVAMRDTWPVVPASVSTPEASEAGPEMSAIWTGSPLDAVAETASGGLLRVTFAGAANEIVWGRSAAKLAVTDLLEFMRMVRLADAPVASPVQPANAFPGCGVATAVAWALGG